ncbi:chain length determinant protein EpsF [Macromonas nakdongensis]|uniref:chain length determinant protein EpsF n=1 Tax=Macromonas nakdongensis TaxID=1843082 RepID=UPI000C33BB7A|nr:chain length determinant protein EpsF [Macromonas nakdongensis]
MTLTQFLLILKARWWVALLALALTVLTTLGVSLYLPKQYTASAAVVVDVRSPDAITGIALGGNVNASYMATQVDIINSDRVARTVVQQLRMDQSPAIRADWQEATRGQMPLVDWLAPLLRRNLEVRPSRESNVISIQYTGADPAFAAAVANAFANAYIAVNLDLRVAPARQFAAFFEEQTQAARVRLEGAQKTLSDYLRESGMTSADQRLDVETARLNEISSQLTTIQGLTTDSGSKRQSGQADTLVEVISNPLINNLKADVARTEAKLQEASIHQGPNHPTTQRLQQELATFKAQLDAETRQVISSVNTSYQVGRQREQQLQAALAAQRSRVLQLNQQRDEVLVLQREVDAAQRAFDAVSARATQTNVESQANQTNVSLLTAAVAPLDHSKPKVFLNLLVSVFLGTLLGVGLALVLELIDRRVRSAEDLTETLGLPLLATIAQAKVRA